MLGLSVYTIPAGSVGVVTRWSAVNRVVYPGIGFRIPVAEWVVKMDVRTQKDQVDATAASRDLQAITSTIAVNYHLDGKYAVDVYQNVGKRYKDILLAPAIQNIFKATTAKFTAEELITNREAVRLQADAQAVLKNAGALTVEYLHYLALTKWDGRLPSVVGGAVPFIDLSQFATTTP